MAAVTLEYLARGPFRKFHERHQKRAVLVCHRRAGKTVATIHDLVIKALLTRKPDGFFAYVAPLKTQVKQIAWKYLLKAVQPFGKQVRIQNNELSVTLPNGSTIRLFGADDPDTFRGLYFDGVVLDEFADMKPRVYTECILPALSDRAGWCVFIGTPKGHNEFWKIREKARLNPEQYFYLELKASDTGFIPAKELAEAKLEMSPAEYEQEYECSFEAAIQGSFYAEQLGELEKENQITTVAWLPGIEVQTAWDLGMADSTAIWFFQLVQGEVRVFDYFETSRTPLATIVQILQEKPYEYGKTFLPHDSTKDSLQTGKTILEDLWGYGFDCRKVPKLTIANGINAARKVLKHCWFDRDGCHMGLERLRLYQKTWSQQLAMFTEVPRHDQNSHAADAFRYLAVAVRDGELNVSDMPQVKTHTTSQINTRVTDGPLFTLPPPDTTTTRRKVQRI